MKVPELLVNKVNALEPPAVVAISGYGGSGKSTLAGELSVRLGHAPVICIDSFVTDSTMTDYTNWELFDFARLEQEVLIPFHRSQPICYGRFDWTVNKIKDNIEVPNFPILLIEGVGLFRPQLFRHYTLTVWVRCPLKISSERGKRRDKLQYGVSLDDSWDGLWKKNDKSFFDTYRPDKQADVVVDNMAPLL